MFWSFVVPVSTLVSGTQYVINVYYMYENAVKSGEGRIYVVLKYFKVEKH